MIGTFPLRLPFNIFSVLFCASEITGFDKAELAPAMVPAAPPVATIAAAPRRNCAAPTTSLLVSVAVFTLRTRDMLPGFNLEKGFSKEFETIFKGTVLKDAH